MPGIYKTLSIIPSLFVILSSFTVYGHHTPLFQNADTSANLNIRNENSTAPNSLTFVKNSGICETVEGVGQSSGYINLEGNNSFWFWFFESRNAPDTDPLVLWLNGGPGCSSMIGLFAEHGPCTVNSDQNSTSINPHSWNNYSNILYLDQPFGVGLSTGVQIDNTTHAATYVWSAFQVLFKSEEFSKYSNRPFVLATESYGARFGPVFINYFNSQNQLIDEGKLDGVKVVASGLIINDGKHDPMIGMSSLISFVKDAPGYGQLTSDKVVSQITAAFENTCQDLLQTCYDTDPLDEGAAQLCYTAITNCTTTIYTPAIGNRDPSFLLVNESQRSIPSKNYIEYITQPHIQDIIGVSLIPGHEFSEQCSSSVKARFSRSGETGRSFLPDLAVLADSKFPILIWAGDADIKANWLGVHRSMVEMSWYGNLTLNNTSLTNMTIDGETVAQYKVVDNFSFARVFGAGHNLPAYKPHVAQVIFSRFIANETLLDSVVTTEKAGL